jgi:hypothetical protein
MLAFSVKKISKEKKNERRILQDFYKIFKKADISLKKSKMVASTEINLKIISIN